MIVAAVAAGLLANLPGVSWAASVTAPARPPIAAGGGHSLILLQHGSVVGMGRNLAGQLGDGSFQDKSDMVEVHLGGRKAADVAAGGRHSLILLRDGAVMTMGNNGDGQLGDGKIALKYPSPLAVPLGGKKAIGIAAGGSHSLVLLQDGGVLAMGDNYFGQLGDGTTRDKHTPVEALLRGRAAVDVAAGGCHSLILLHSGAVLAMGNNIYGQLGVGTTQGKTRPVLVALGSKTAVAVAAGGTHSLILLQGGSVLGMGNNGDGQLGAGMTASSNPDPTEIPLSGKKAVAVSAGVGHSLILLEDGTVLAMGSNSRGQLGDGTRESRHNPVAVPLSGRKAVAIAAGSRHSVILCHGGSILAMGANDHGQLLDATDFEKLDPVVMIPAGELVVSEPTSYNDHDQKWLAQTRPISMQQLALNRVWTLAAAGFFSVAFGVMVLQSLRCASSYRLRALSGGHSGARCLDQQDADPLADGVGDAAAAPLHLTVA